MMATILYFARLRETFGVSNEQLALPPSVQDVAGLVALLRARGTVWESELAPGKAFRIAVNQTMVSADAPVADADEIAIFPPVTGG
jgi:molybdopterin synthase sulfur carrier subunit